MVSENVVGRNWGVSSVASPVRRTLLRRLCVDLRMAIGMCHVRGVGAVRTGLGVLIRGGAVSRYVWVYGNITVRFDMLGILLGILMGGAILKIQ